MVDYKICSQQDQEIPLQHLMQWDRLFCNVVYQVSIV